MSDSKIAAAARGLIEAMDLVLGTGWRDEKEDRDEMNDAWDELLEAIEGKPSRSS